MVIAPHTGAVLGYDPLKDFAPVSLLTRNTVVLVVHPSVPAKTLQGVHGAREGAAGQAVLRLLRRRRAEPSRRRNLQPDGGPQHRARAVSRHRRGAAGGDRQPGRRHVGLHRRPHPVHPRRQAPRARRLQHGALAGAAGRPDRGGGRRARLRGHLLDRDARARRNPAGDPRQAVERRQRRHEGRDGARDVGERRHRHRGEQAGRIPRGDRERSCEIRQARGRVQDVK